MKILDQIKNLLFGKKAEEAPQTKTPDQYTWPEDNRNRLTMMGKFDHVREIERHTAERYEPHKDEIQEELKKYRQMEQFTVKAPSKQK